MEKDMLEQIQQMITTATESLRQEMTGIASRLDQKVDGLATSLRAEMVGMKTDLRQEMGSMESRLSERLEETKRHSGILAEDLHHKLDLVIEGQQFLGQRIDNVQTDLDSKNRETRVFLELSYRQLNDRLDRHEQRHPT